MAQSIYVFFIVFNHNQLKTFSALQPNYSLVLNTDFEINFFITKVMYISMFWFLLKWKCLKNS